MGWGRSNRFQEQVSNPQGDTIDRIHMTAIDIQPGESRSAEITLICTGMGAEYVLWTTLVGGKQLGCGQTLHAGLTYDNNQISFDITYPDGESNYSSVTYVLSVVFVK